MNSIRFGSDMANSNLPQSVWARFGSHLHNSQFITWLHTCRPRIHSAYWFECAACNGRHGDASARIFLWHSTTFEMWRYELYRTWCKWSRQRMRLFLYRLLSTCHLEFSVLISKFFINNAETSNLTAQYQRPEYVCCTTLYRRSLTAVVVWNFLLQCYWKK